MRELDELRQRLEKTERLARWLTAFGIVLAAALVLGATQGNQEVLTLRGLVITDAAGNERIVLGAPMASASEDPKLADAVGLAVLDSVGRLHVAVGANKPLITTGGQLGTRIALDAGLTFYDPRDGRERGGIGAFDDGRANMCIDYGTAPKEGACVAIAPGVGERRVDRTQPLAVDPIRFGGQGSLAEREKSVGREVVGHRTHVHSVRRAIQGGRGQNDRRG